MIRNSPWTLSLRPSSDKSTDGADWLRRVRCLRLLRVDTVGIEPTLSLLKRQVQDQRLLRIHGGPAGNRTPSPKPRIYSALDAIVHLTHALGRDGSYSAPTKECLCGFLPHVLPHIDLAGEGPALHPRCCMAITDGYNCRVSTT